MDVDVSSKSLRQDALKEKLKKTVIYYKLGKQCYTQAHVDFE